MNQLYHWGIKGQKWGIRRFQNQDGTRTQAGKQRYYSDDYKEAHDGKKASQLSTQQLNRRNNRFQAEQTYKKNTESSASRNTKKAAKFVGKLLIGVGAAVATSYIKKALDKQVGDGIQATKKYINSTKKAIKRNNFHKTGSLKD